MVDAQVVADRPVRSELLNLDLLRFLAAVGVVVYHYRENWFLGPTWAVDRLDGLSVLVDLFFALSGVVICHVYGHMTSAREYVSFLKRRVARLGPLHWATLVFYGALFLISARLGYRLSHPGAANWNCFIPSALLVQSWGGCHAMVFNSVSWSISAEMAMYILFPVFLLLSRRAAPVFLLAIALGAALYMGQIPRQQWSSWLPGFGVARALVGFPLGVAIYQSRRLFVRWVPAWAFYVLVILFPIGMLAGWPKAALIPLAYAIVAAGLAADQRAVPGVVRRLAPLGDLTYGIYMLHRPVQAVMMSVLAVRILKLGPAGQAWMIPVDMVIVVVLAAMTLVWFERPWRRILSSIPLGSYGSRRPAESVA